MDKALTPAAACSGNGGVRSFWDMLRGSGGVFESTVKGTSMEPTIPDGSRVRIRTRPAQAYEVGQIVAFTVKDEIFAHRIVHCARGARARDAVITLGDNHMLCDPPTRKGDILGQVTEVSKNGVWSTPEPRVNRIPIRRVLSALHRLLIRCFLPVHFELARRVAGTSRVIASLLRRRGR